MHQHKSRRERSSKAQRLAISHTQKPKAHHYQCQQEAIFHVPGPMWFHSSLTCMHMCISTKMWKVDGFLDNVNLDNPKGILTWSNLLHTNSYEFVHASHCMNIKHKILKHITFSPNVLFFSSIQPKSYESFCIHVSIKSIVMDKNIT